MPVDDDGKFVATPTRRKKNRRARSKATRSGRPTRDPLDTHRYRDWLQGVPMGKNMPPASFPPEMADWIADHIEAVGLVHVDELHRLADGDGKIAVDDLPQQWIKHRYRPGEPQFFISPGEWVPIDEPDRPDVEPDEPDLSGAEPEALDVMERAIKKARIAQQKLEQADPAAQAAANRRAE